MSFKKIIHSISYKIECKKNVRIKRKIQAKKKEDILNFYGKNKSENLEINEALSFLKKNKIETFCSDFTKAYKWDQIAVFNDDSKGLPYVIHEGKRLYFIRSYRKRTIQYCYSGLLAEQDSRSPHCYLDEGFNIHENDTMLDVGSAEGILSLQHIEKLKQVVLFERDPEWIEALEATFEPWKEKVTIVRKFVSNINDNENITLDCFLADKTYSPSFIKIDVEGAEEKVLNGMTNTLNIPALKIAICTYHQMQDFAVLSDYLIQRDFNCQPSIGLMLFLNNPDNLQAPFFRKGLIRAEKKN